MRSERVIELREYQYDEMKTEMESNKALIQRHRWMLAFLIENKGECLGDHPDWIADMYALIAATTK